MNKTGIAVISGLVGVALTAAVAAIIMTSSKAPTEQIPQTVTETSAPTTAMETLPITLPQTTAAAQTVTETTAAPAVLPAPAPETESTTAAPAVLPAPAPVQTQAPAVQPAPAPNTSETKAVTVEITKEEAEEIALKHAGLTDADVVFSRTEYDREYGANEWEVEFHQGRTEYSYTINAETGAIIEYEVDRD